MSSSMAATASAQWGLASGDWKTIAAIVDDELASEDHTLVEFAP